MITLIIIFITAYMTNKFTRLYCIFRYKNDAKFISEILKNEEIIINVKEGVVLND